MSNRVCLENLPRTIELAGDDVKNAWVSFVDQRKLPDELVIQRTQSWQELVEAIETLALRGAPALGVGGASALALWALGESDHDSNAAGGPASEFPRYRKALESVAATIAQARPTAVNLRWGTNRVLEIARTKLVGGASKSTIARAMYDEVKRMEQEDEAANRALGAYGAQLLEQDCRILTHCNAGSLATVFYGTALGVVYAAAEQGKIARVYADETRPVGQGARLSAWELSRVGVPCTLICDNMAASLMAKKQVDAVVVGADRITTQGDVANKIGTYGLAVLARYHRIPFYVAAPLSTVDFSLSDGAQIPLEERSALEVMVNPPEGVSVWNPAFDVTPAHLITSIITEKGVFQPDSLKECCALSSVISQ